MRIGPPPGEAGAARSTLQTRTNLAGRTAIGVSRWQIQGSGTYPAMVPRMCIRILAPHKGRVSFTEYTTTAPIMFSLVTHYEGPKVVHRFCPGATATYLDHQFKSVLRDVLWESKALPEHMPWCAANLLCSRQTSRHQTQRNTLSLRMRSRLTTVWFPRRPYWSPPGCHVPVSG